MNRRGTKAPPRLSLEPAMPKAFLERLQTVLARQPPAAVVVDLTAVGYADPQTLRVLSAAARAAGEAGVELFLDRVAPSVYKAIQIAKLDRGLQRVHHGARTGPPASGSDYEE
jgi:anti-anti-sigma factor